jgi:hypothetical protein
MPPGRKIYNIDALWAKPVRTRGHRRRICATTRATMKIAHYLREENVKAAQRSWDLEMALRNVRLAETGAEKAQAVVKLHKTLQELQPHFPVAAE